MELKINHESSDQNYLFILLKMLPTCSGFISHLWQLEELNLFCPKFVSLNFVVEYERSGSLLFTCSWCCLLDLCLMLCDDRRPRERETRWTHHSIVRNWRPARAICHLRLLAYGSNGIFLSWDISERFTANQNHCSHARILWTLGWELGIEICFL